MKTILYCLTGPVPTVAQAAEITVLNAIADAPYKVLVINGSPKHLLQGITLSADQSDNSYNDSGATITAGTISAAQSDNSYNDSGSGFLTAGFQVGDYVTVSGFTGDTANNQSGYIESVTAAKMIIKSPAGDLIVDDAATESVTISAPGRFLARGFAVGMTVSVRGFSGNSANNIDSATITAVTAGKMTIGGTDGNVIVSDAAGEAVTISSTETDAGYGSAVIVADYIAGTVPEAYKSSGTAIYPVFDPANPPDVAALVETQGVISHGETVVLHNSAGTTSDNATATVAAHAVSVALPSNKTVVESTDTVNVGSDPVTLTVTAGVLASGSIGGTKTIVEAADTLALTTAGTVTFGVSGGTLTGDIAATTAVVANNATTTVDGKTVTLTVANRVLTGGTIVGTQKIMASGDTILNASGSGTTVTLTITGGTVTAALS